MYCVGENEQDLPGGARAAVRRRWCAHTRGQCGLCAPYAHHSDAVVRKFQHGNSGIRMCATWQRIHRHTATRDAARSKPVPSPARASTPRADRGMMVHSSVPAHIQKFIFTYSGDESTGCQSNQTRKYYTNINSRLRSRTHMFSVADKRLAICGSHTAVLLQWYAFYNSTSFR